MVKCSTFQAVFPWHAGCFPEVGERSRRHVETSRRIFGEDIWNYSVEGSRPTLEALVGYLDEQGLTARRMRVEELFVPNIGPKYEAYLGSFYH